MRRGPREYAIQCDIETMLRPVLLSEKVKILTRILVHVLNQDPRQTNALKVLAKQTFEQELQHLNDHRSSGGPAGFARSSMGGGS